METLVIFGNCQAEAIAAALRFCPVISKRHELVCLPSYNRTSEEEAEVLNEDVRARCTILLEQVTPLVRISNRFAFPHAKITTFPSLDFNLIWPLRAAEPRAHPEPPAFPFGRYPYGDRLINKVVAAGLEGDAAWDAFCAGTLEAMPDLQRLEVIEQRRWEFGERNLDVAMSDVIFPHYRLERLFWTYNHPNRLVLCRFGARILAAAGLAESEQDGFELMTGILSWEFGADYQAPIHPKVGTELGLEWWNNDMSYRRYGDAFDYENFIRNQIAWI